MFLSRAVAPTLHGRFCFGLAYIWSQGPCQNPMVDATTSPLAAPGISNMELPKSMISAYTIVQLVAAAIPEFVLQNRRGRGLSNMVLTPSL